ncbi:hypothetical protein FACS189472_09790 [Alphaproteobacteria bacterium]|nr:hypothetical protein FACS189472_09790 [Alphaproteobacteria bacterium]
MVGIFKKIKDGLNWIKNKVVKNLLPYVGKLGDIVDSDALQTVIKAIAPVADTIIPGLGTGINTAREFISKAGSGARTLMKGFANVPNLAKRPNQLHDRIQLKSLPPPSDEKIDNGLAID